MGTCFGSGRGATGFSKGCGRNGGEGRDSSRGLGFSTQGAALVTGVRGVYSLQANDFGNLRIRALSPGVIGN